MAGIYEKADQLEAKNQKIKTDKARNAIFERLISVLKQNFGHQGLTTKTVSLKAGSGLEAHFGNIAYEVNFKEIVYNDFIQEAKQFIVRITLQQIACHVMSEDTIRFSITEDHLKTFKNKFEELTFEQFLNDPTRPRVKPVKKETANPEKEIIASSENTKLNEKEMTAQTATQTGNQVQRTATEQLKFIQDFLESKFSRTQYSEPKINSEKQRVEFKANTPYTRQEIEGSLKSAKIPYGKPLAENTKTLWFSLIKYEDSVVEGPVNEVTNLSDDNPYAAFNEMTKAAQAKLKKEIQVFLKGKRLQNTIAGKSGFSFNFRSNEEMKTAYLFVIVSKLYVVESLDKTGDQCFLITGRKDPAKKGEEIAEATTTTSVSAKVAQNTSKRKSELTPEEQDRLKELRSDINYDLSLSGKFNYKNYILGPLGSKQNFVVANCGAFVEPILEFLQQSYDVKKSPRGNKALWIFGKKDSEPESIIQNDLDAQEATEDDADRKQFKSSISSLENLFELYVLQKKEIVELNEKLAISSGHSEKDIFLGLTKLYQDLVAGGGDLMVRLRQPDDSEIMNRIDLEKFLKYFANVFIENKE